MRVGATSSMSSSLLGGASQEWTRGLGESTDLVG